MRNGVEMGEKWEGNRGEIEWKLGRNGLEIGENWVRNGQ